MNEHRLTVSRSARYFTLGPAAPATDVWFVLHGYGQLAARFLHACAPLDDGARLIVAPEGLNRFYVEEEMKPHRKVGATWMTREDRLAEIEDYVRYLDAVHADVGRGLSGAARRVTVLGFSQGSATACRWAVQGAAPVSRLILWGGEVPPDLDAAALRRVPAPVVFVHGSEDPMITPKIAAATAARLVAHGVAHEMVPFDGGHAIDAALLARLAS